MVAGQNIKLGPRHRGKIVTVVIEDSQFRILHDGNQLSAHADAAGRRSASGR